MASAYATGEIPDMGVPLKPGQNHYDELCGLCGWRRGKHRAAMYFCPNEGPLGNNAWTTNVFVATNLGGIHNLSRLPQFARTTPRPRPKKKEPDKCPGCGQPAYFGFNDVECSVSCRPQYTRKP